MSARKNGAPSKTNSSEVSTGDTPVPPANAAEDATGEQVTEDTAVEQVASVHAEDAPVVDVPEPQATSTVPPVIFPEVAIPPEIGSHPDSEILRLLQEQASSLGSDGTDDDDVELSEEERRYLDSHLKANPLHQVNEHCFTEVNVFRQMNITFYNLRANSKAFLSIRPDQMAIWSDGGENSKMVGLSFSTSTQPTLYLRNFLINAREMYLETYQDCSEINIGLYVRTEQFQLKGRVDLPPGASVTLQSRCDRTSIIGLSSFGIDLE